MVDHGSVTGKLFLTRPDYLPLVVVFTNALDGGQGFATASLLDPDVDQSLLVTKLICVVCVCKWVILIQVELVHVRLELSVFIVGSPYGSIRPLVVGVPCVYVCG